MSDCNGNCSSCSSASSCDDKQNSMLEATHELNKIGKVVPIVGGKGGVGKSLVTGLTAIEMRRKGYKVGILDADITGPSIPKMFGANTKPEVSENGIMPYVTENGIKIISINMFLESQDSPVLWRGPILAGAVKQFWTDVIWGELDYLFIDMPPGTGDVPITVFQSIKVDEIIIVTSPQELVSLIVKKAYNMAQQMNIPVIGLVENMSYIKCPDCDSNYYLFGKGKTKEVAKELNLDLLGQIPIDPKIAELCDAGNFEKYDKAYLDKLVEKLV